MAGNTINQGKTKGHFQRRVACVCGGTVEDKDWKVERGFLILGFEWQTKT
jgi:hypothetical protein